MQQTALGDKQLTELHSVKKGKINTILTRLRRDKYLYLLAAPGILYFLIFKYIPIGGVVIAFQEYSPFKGILHSKWVGFENFERFFLSSDFMKLLRNTMVISVLNLVFFFPAPIILSLLLNEARNSKFKRTIQSVVYLPHFFSWVIVAGITFLLFSQSGGIVNSVIQMMGYSKIDFLTNENYFWVMLTLQSIWKEAGWGTVIFLAAIAGVDPALYEAAKMDGANRLQQMKHITMPAIQNVVITLLILRMGHVLDVGFEQVYLMMNSAVTDVADVFETYVYRMGIQNGQFSFTTAVGLFKSVVGLILVIATNKLAKTYGKEGLY
ncbi:putative aldouronate transport system permease protein [Paenibacillus sp. UNCCL117]|uniref:ABC transporter permease n=1 Tax=unclassified Paenibacillus TaxID=185978 RepID=UPI000883E42F|nr:putative aldouronate transport system permease protein [Paenibacillus sp. cl123]SFW12672.1 putative aldouronate transport system permease protein [Paenibacillus sp. UNCCL117]